MIDYVPTGAADAATHLEESVLGIQTGGKANKKRPAGDTSDSSSESEMPIAAKPAPKRRRVNKSNHLQDITADLDPSLAGPPADMSSMTSTIPLVIKPATGRGRGKGKQREEQADSVSSTPRGRKKLGVPKNKIDILPPQTQEALGLTASTSMSASRDASPVASRAPSPALTNVSATIYELDDQPPALKRAKRIDDNAMWKRIKTLEEAQRKVWTNIARRDIVKVCIEFASCVMVEIRI